jgi:spore maturation protein SpmB
MDTAYSLPGYPHGSLFHVDHQTSPATSTALFTDIKTTGPDSIATKMTAVIMGNAETTFVLAVYLGAVGIRKTRYLVPVCLIAIWSE